MPLPDSESVRPWGECKSKRGHQKRVDTSGYACPHAECAYFGITDARVHAIVGYGWIDPGKTIQKLRCQACQKTFTSRIGTPLYYLKTDPEEVEMVLWFLAEGVNQAVQVRYTGHTEDTIARWLKRAGEHAQRWLRQLVLAVLQIDELYARVRSTPRKRWLWLALDPVTKLIPGCI